VPLDQTEGKVLLLNAVRQTNAPSRFVFRLEYEQSAADDLERFRQDIDAL
jgi:hypothetical protein